MHGSVDPAPEPPARRFRHCHNLATFLSAFCLFLSAIEYLIPKPLPFMRLGISNLPVILALDLLPAPMVLVLVLLKVLGQAMLSGTLISYIFLFSAAGSFSSALLMLAARNWCGDRISFIGVSVLGAVASNLVQILMARVFIFGAGAWLIGPPFVAMGLVTGIALGWFCERFARRSAWFARMKAEDLC
jgi:heptaprenyl diphosphate synthase